jgi:hypothetical protein
MVNLGDLASWGMTRCGIPAARVHSHQGQSGDTEEHPLHAAPPTIRAHLVQHDGSLSHRPDLFQMRGQCSSPPVMVDGLAV